MEDNMVDRIFIAALWCGVGAAIGGLINLEGYAFVGALIGVVFGYLYAVDRGKRIENEIESAAIDQRDRERIASGERPIFKRNEPK